MPRRPPATELKPCDDFSVLTLRTSTPCPVLDRSSSRAAWTSSWARCFRLSNPQPVTVSAATPIAPSPAPNLSGTDERARVIASP